MRMKETDYWIGNSDTLDPRLLEAIFQCAKK